MTQLTSRPFADERDVERMRAFLFHAKQARPDKPHWHSSDFAWGYFLSTISGDPRGLYRLWEREGDVVAFALFDPRDMSFDMPMHPDIASDALREEMFSWVLERFKAVRKGDSELLTGGSDDDVEAYIAFLRRKGFERAEDFYVHYARSLDEPMAEAPLPDDFVVRTVAGEHEHAARAAAHRNAFHPSRVTDEHYLRFMRLPVYDRETDIVAVAPDGTIASFAKFWIDGVNRVAEFEPVGTHDDYLRRGLSRAVLLEGLRRMKARGMRTATVLTGGNDDSTGARKLYESVGFKPVRRDYDWSWRE